MRPKGEVARQSFSGNVGSTRCSRVVLSECGFILSECGFERHYILMESGLKIAMLSGRWIYIIGQLHLRSKGMTETLASYFMARCRCLAAQ
jgi:hypothetical protein